MNNGRVIRMGNPNDRMGQLIEQAKEKAEREYQEKLEKSRASDVDVRDFFSDEELNRILSDNEFFQGKVADLTVMQRYEKAVMAARWLEAHSMEIVGLDVEKVTPKQPNAIICLDIRRLASLRGMELKVFTALTALADSVFLSGIKDAHIRFTFGIEGVWRG